MAAHDMILCADIGGDSIKIAEFLCPTEGGFILQKFAYREYGNTIDEESAEALAEALRDVILTNNFSAKKIYISLSGQNAFIRFVKVPAMTNDKAKIKGIIEYEAKQTIPFPMNEVVWDSQQIESDDIDSSEIEAMFVIMKNEEVTKVTDIMDELGINVNLIEVAPTACYNAARANAIGEEECEMVLNIGGRCSTLVFVDGGKFFVRPIPIAGHSITQQISKEFGISFADAEEMKRRHGFVALGGAYEEPESEVAATVSKIVRNVMTRLHGEINRSINVYRAQQKGRRPEKLHLAGGSSVMAFTPRFFSEKLRIPVEYFNPFQIVTLNPDVDKDNLAEVAHLFAEPIGLALRHIGSCQIRISLIPESLRKQNALKLKIPYFYASAAALIVCLGLTYWVFDSQVALTEKKLEKVKEFHNQKEAFGRSVKKAYGELMQTKSEFETANSYLSNRKDWVTLFNELQKVLPDNAWFSRITVQQNSGVTASVRKDEPDPADMGFNLFGGMGRTPSASTQTTVVASAGTDLEWVILEGSYVLTPELRNEAHEILMMNLSLTPSQYFSKDDVFATKAESTLETGTNLASFRIAVKLTEPINKQKK